MGLGRNNCGVTFTYTSAALGSVQVVDGAPGRTPATQRDQMFTFVYDGNLTAQLLERIMSHPGIAGYNHTPGTNRLVVTLVTEPNVERHFPGQKRHDLGKRIAQAPGQTVQVRSRAWGAHQNFERP